MTIDDLLKRPLEPVRDDGFSARLALTLLRRRQRRHTLMLSLAAIILVPLLALLPLAPAGHGLLRLLEAATLMPHFVLLGGAIMAWGLWPRPYRF